MGNCAGRGASSDELKGDVTCIDEDIALTALNGAWRERTSNGSDVKCINAQAPDECISTQRESEKYVRGECDGTVGNKAIRIVIESDEDAERLLPYKSDTSKEDADGTQCLRLTPKQHMTEFEPQLDIEEAMAPDDFTDTEEVFQSHVPYNDYENIEYKNRGIKLRIGNINLVFRKGNIVDQHVDVIICAVDKTLDLRRERVSKELSRAGGKKIQNECRSKYPNGIGNGAVAVVNAGKLYCQKVYFISLPKYDGHRNNSIQAFKATITSCLEKADDANFKSTAMPAIGVEHLYYPVDVAVEATLAAVKSFSNTCTNTELRTISVICNDDEDLFKELLKEVNGKLQMVSTASETSVCSEDSNYSLVSAVQETLLDEQVRLYEPTTEPFEGKWTGHDVTIGQTSLMDGRRFEQTTSKQVANRLDEQPSENLVDQEKIRKCIREKGSSSEQVLKLLDWICSLAKPMFKKLICLWAGYESEQKCEPVLVAIVEEPQLNIPEKFHTFKLIQIKYGQLSNEAKYVTDLEKEIKFTDDESTRLQQCIAKYAQALMKNHSNLLIVSASKYKSKGFGTEDQSIERNVSIVLYVHIKGMIPFGEEPFPKTLDEFPVDVRESMFQRNASSKDYMQSLMMGCYIESAHNKCGTLGAFVQSNDGTIFALTCCHIFTPEIGNNGFNPNVYQPTAAQPGFKFGEVTGYSNLEQYDNKITVDAALIRITDQQRLPRSGRFPDAESIEAGFSPDNPMLFNSGKIVRGFSDIPRACNIVKYGATSEHTIGDLNLIGVAARGLDVVEVPLIGQIEVIQRDNKEFATNGDSGALVFCVTTTTYGEEIRALGIYVGNCAHGPSIITPIWAVLGKFNLPMQLLSFNVAQGNSLRYGQECVDDKSMELDSAGTSASAPWNSELAKAKAEQEAINKRLEQALHQHSNVISANQKRIDKLESFQFKSGSTVSNEKPPSRFRSTPDVVPV